MFPLSPPPQKWSQALSVQATKSELLLTLHSLTVPPLPVLWKDGILIFALPRRIELMGQRGTQVMQNRASQVNTMWMCL